jgi:hypothetical protein
MNEKNLITVHRVGFYTAVLTVIFTLITFGFALTAIPISGANCLANCISYPYLDTVSQFPRDYLWMIPACLLILLFVTLITTIHGYAASHKKIFTQIGLSFAIIAAVILLSDYFIQFSVVPVSLMNGETAGISLLTQYNPHGIFIALEELGYLMMSLSFLCVAPAFASTDRLETAVQRIFVLSFVLVIGSFAVISFIHGLERLDRFEVIIITINWLVLIVNGTLLSIVFRRQLRAA